MRFFYDLQRLRMQAAGRNLPKGAKPDSEERVQVELHELDKTILASRADELLGAEKTALRDVEDHLRTMPIYTDVLADKTRFKGVGPTMAGVILAENDIRRQRTVSTMWKFSGLAPLPAWRCCQCNKLVVEVQKDKPQLGFKHAAKAKECLEVVPQQMAYPSGKTMRPTRGEPLPYNAFLRAKMIGVLGPSLLKCNSPWRKAYDDKKHQLQTMGKGVSDMHRHNMAVRFMVKMLLAEIWKEWRTIEGLPVRGTYHEEKMEHVHGALP